MRFEMTEHQETTLISLANYGFSKLGRPGGIALVNLFPSEELTRDWPEQIPGLSGIGLSMYLLDRSIELGLLDHITSQFLRATAEDYEHSSQSTAIKIIEQMDSDLAIGRRCRIPIRHFVATEEGIALMLIVDDLFWTDRWEYLASEVD